MPAQGNHPALAWRGVAAAGTRRGLMASAAATGAAFALAACGPLDGASQSRPGAASGEVSVLYYTSTEPATARMQRQEAWLKAVLPSVTTTMVPTPDIAGKFV